MHILLIIILVLLFIKGQAWIYGNRWDDKLKAEVKFSKQTVEENEFFQVVETVENGKKLHLPSLSVKFSTSPELVVSGLVKDDNANVSDRLYYSDIVPAMGKTRVVRKIKCYARKRGMYSIDSIYLSSENLFLNADMHESVDNDATILVYPKHINLLKNNMPFNTLLGDICTKLKLIEDPFEFKGLREYDSADSMKLINWKASAKTGEYIVNSFVRTESKSIILMFNISQASGRFEDELIEDSLRLIVSLAEEYLYAGFSVSFVTNAVDTVSEEELYLDFGKGLRQMELINEATARINSDARARELNSLDRFSEAVNSRDYLVLVSFNQDKKLCEPLAERLDRGQPFYWIVPTNYNIDYVLPEEFRGVSAEWSTNENH